MKMFNEEIQSQLKEIFQDLKNDVTIALFTKEGECYSCAETLSYMQEVEELSDKIHLDVYDIEKDAEMAELYHVEMVPSIVLLDSEKKYHGIKFNGIPAGHEINSFIPAIIEVSGNASELPQELEARIKNINKPVNIKVFVTLSCPHCPGAVQKAHKMALINPLIEAEMIEAETFEELSMKHNVSGVPKIVFNDQVDLLGNQPIQEFLKTMESL
ncbi:thioredoxin family protein [Proteiniclasticum sp. BAD-10]|uniref:Thioredoxin family protein n=1 Tax=Proteiniclasticum sediminis TaxID=2804028 RepID=A0A941HQJ9_9CLOT|nr:thioredoxin family protein [Proteiniclasticum sediminis]MBR0576085.1 thioredoxin family protein [Proteiniclasticum sediminis]